MKALIVYDSVYGNTEQIAQAISKALNSEMNVIVSRVTDVKADQLIELKLLIVGSPTHGGRFTEAIQAFLNDISKLPLEGTNVAAFDTRTSSSGVVGFLEKRFGHAAVRIANVLKKQGRNFIGEPEGFIVKGRKGPLKGGELERAENWANDIVGKIV